MAAARALSVAAPSAWARVKLPLLKAPLLTAAAIGFAVSIMQFVPAQLIAAGRFSTLPMEAVTLSSGGSRPLTAAFALALALPPLLGFLAAALLGRPRWR
jgi:putative thiamine transport system permease protein